MTSTTSSELIYDPTDPETIRDPYPLFARLRDEAPLYHHESQDFNAVSRYDDITQVLLNRETFISRKGVTLGILQSGMNIPPGTLIFEDPPTHTIHRALLSRMFTPRRIGGLEAEIRDLCAGLMDPLVGSGGFDLVAEVASQVPMRVIGMLVGIPEADQEGVRDQFLSARDDGGRHLEDGALSGAIFADYVDWRAENPADDIISHLLNAEFDDENGKPTKLTRDELLAYVNIVAAAGNETTRILIGYTGKLLAENPDQRALVAADPSLSNNAIEEILRFEPNTLQNCRYVASDVEIHGEVVPAGSFMVTLTPAGNRDERHFDDPDRLDVQRKIDHHVSFGFGSHYCLGQALARLEARVVLEELLVRFPEWDVDLAQAEFMYHTDNRGYSKLPITLP
ncbi:MAG TPA: cytochrome P450 [Acidimicrobiales bacterium]